MSTSKTLCPIPWHSISVRNDGLLRVCCHANVSDGSGILKNDRGEILSASHAAIEEARNSDTLKNMRRQMIEGAWPVQCRRCQSEESVGVRSKRLYSSEYMPLDKKTLEATDSHTGHIDTSKVALKDGDLRFGNKCNLRCRMCGPSDSSSWVGDYQKLTGKEYKIPGDFNWFSNKQFWEDFDRYAGQLEHLYLVGGEPLLIDEHFRFLRRLVSSGTSRKIVLEYNTNLTTLTDEILELWKDFKEIRIGISIDAFGVLNDYIRYPSKFSHIEKNLERLDRSEIKLKAWLATTVSIYNFLDLNDLFLWKIDKNFIQIGRSQEKPLVTTHFLHKPEILSIKGLPAEVKERATLQIPDLRVQFVNELNNRNIGEEAKTRYLAQWDKIHQGIEKFMSHAHLADDQSFESSIDWNRRLDQIRKIDRPHPSQAYKNVFEGYL